jgi:short-subunit dehydrogenase
MSKQLKPLHEQTVVIMGASSGIGLATAQRAAERGANVVLVSRNGEALERICGEIRDNGGRADYVVADVGVREQVRNVVDEVVHRHGGFDTWINNAGVGIYATLTETTDEDHEKVFQTNYWGVVYGCTEALKYMRHRGGALISTGSISSDIPSPILGVYTATKHAVKGYIDSLRLELQHDESPVSVTLIKPSGIHSPFGRHARNYMAHASKVPPPVYSPYVVADAMLHAAEHPTRDLVVGGSGASLISLVHLLPRAADRLLEKMFFLTAVDKDRPPRENEALHQPGDGGQVLGDQKGYMMKSSAYTEARKHPVATLALGAATVAAWVASRQRRNGGGRGLRSLGRG